jgi:hypothetical protein
LPLLLLLLATCRFAGPPDVVSPFKGDDVDVDEFAAFPLPFLLGLLLLPAILSLALLTD